MHDEIDSMKQNGTWELVPKPPKARVINCKWIYKLKDGLKPTDPPRYKSRLVAKGFSQKEGIDYNDIFAPVVKYKTLRLMIAMPAVFDWHLEQMDVKTAFLHGDLEEIFLMSQPIGFIDKKHPDYVCFLKKSIYGLKQSPRQWNKKYDACMISLHFTRSKYDTCLYFKNVNAKFPLYVLLYVDDILMISGDKSAIAKIKGDLSVHFDIKDLGHAKKILGVNILRDKQTKTIYLSQSDYVTKVVDNFGMKNSKPVSIPLGGHLELSKVDCPKSDQDKLKMSKIPYDVAVGSVMYAMLCTRPDLAFSISVLSRFMSNPGGKHWLGMKYLLRYLSSTVKLGLVFSDFDSQHDITGYVDSDYVSNKDNRKSTTSFFFTWAGNCISWKSQLQSIVALSSTEAEYIAATEAVKEAIWLKGIVKEVQGRSCVPILHMDSQSALYLCKDPVYHERTKHIDVRFHFIRDMVESKQIINPADFGTKIVPSDKFLFCRKSLHILDIP
ncbi:unnamed protein product [Rhodiola kirilowii]